MVKCTVGTRSNGRHFDKKRTAVKPLDDLDKWKLWAKLTAATSIIENLYQATQVLGRR